MRMPHPCVELAVSPVEHLARGIINQNRSQSLSPKLGSREQIYEDGLSLVQFPK